MMKNFCSSVYDGRGSREADLRVSPFSFVSPGEDGVAVPLNSSSSSYSNVSVVLKPGWRTEANPWEHIVGRAAGLLCASANDEADSGDGIERNGLGSLAAGAR